MKIISHDYLELAFKNLKTSQQQLNTKNQNTSTPTNVDDNIQIYKTIDERVWGIDRKQAYEKSFSKLDHESKVV